MSNWAQNLMGLQTNPDQTLTVNMGGAASSAGSALRAEISLVIKRLAKQMGLTPNQSDPGDNVSGNDSELVDLAFGRFAGIRRLISAPALAAAIGKNRLRKRRATIHHRGQTVQHLMPASQD